MYQLHVSVQETIGAFICQAHLSDHDQWGTVVKIGSSIPAYLSPDADGIPEDLNELFRVLARYAAILIDSP